MLVQMWGIWQSVDLNHCCQVSEHPTWLPESSFRYVQLKQPLNPGRPTNHQSVRPTWHPKGRLRLGAALPTNESGWKFPNIQRMPMDSTQLHTHTQTHTRTHWVCRRAFWQLWPCTLESRAYKNSRRGKTELSLRYEAFIFLKKHFK